MATQRASASFTLADLDPRSARKAVRDYVPACTSPRRHVRQVGAAKLSAHMTCTHKAGKREVAA